MLKHCTANSFHIWLDVNSWISAICWVIFPDSLVEVNQNQSGTRNSPASWTRLIIICWKKDHSGAAGRVHLLNRWRSGVSNKYNKYIVCIAVDNNITKREEILANWSKTLWRLHNLPPCVEWSQNYILDLFGWCGSHLVRAFILSLVFNGVRLSPRLWCKCHI